MPGQNSSQAQSPVVPDYLKQTPSTEGQPPMAQIGNLVKALMEGYQKGKVPVPGAQPPGAPTNIQPPAQQQAWPPAGAGVPYAGGGPLGTGANPTMNALFTPPPNPYGVGSAGAVS